MNCGSSKTVPLTGRRTCSRPLNPGSDGAKCAGTGGGSDGDIRTITSSIRPKGTKRRLPVFTSMRENPDPNDAVSASVSVGKDLAMTVTGVPEHGRFRGMDGEFQRRLSSMANVRGYSNPRLRDSRPGRGRRDQEGRPMDAQPAGPLYEDRHEPAALRAALLIRPQAGTLASLSPREIGPC
jgi:hypothetical protein